MRMCCLHTTVCNSNKEAISFDTEDACQDLGRSRSAVDYYHEDQRAFVCQNASVDFKDDVIPIDTREGSREAVESQHAYDRRND